MGLRVQTNVASLNAQRNLSRHTEALGRAFSRLSTGLRIATAADDAAGLAISERLRSQVRSLNQASRNAMDGISLLQTAEGAMNEVNTILVRLRELSVQAANGTVSNEDKETLDQEFQLLVSEIGRIAQATEFNGVALLDGTTGAVTFQVGSGTSTGIDTLDVTLASILPTSLGLAALDIGSGGDQHAAIQAIDTAIDTVTQLRGDFGAAQNRLTSTIANIAVAAENLSAAESRIRDVDVASETAELTRTSILQQASISILSQANIQPQAALTLLRQ